MDSPKAIIVRIEPELVDRIDRLGVDVGLSRTDTVEALLELAMDNVDEGKWDMQQVARQFREEVWKGRAKKK